MPRVGKWRDVEFKWAKSCQRVRSKNMALQAKLTALTVNLKRIAAILSSKKEAESNFISIFSNFFVIDYEIRQMRAG